jgi:DNA-binding Lrp family transcriptional regulator
MKSFSSPHAAEAGKPVLYEPDEVDRKILELLMSDARRSARALAREISMSPGAVSERINRMEAAGVILGYHADIDAALLGFGMDVFIGAQIAHEQDVDDMVEALLEIDEVQTVYVTTGTWDLVIGVRVRDHRHLRDVMLSRIRALPNLQRSEAMIVLDSQQRPKTVPASAAGRDDASLSSP